MRVLIVADDPHTRALLDRAPSEDRCAGDAPLAINR